MLSRIAHQPASHNGTCGLVAMTSAAHAEGRQFDPGQVYIPRKCGDPFQKSHHGEIMTLGVATSLWDLRNELTERTQAKQGK